MLVKIIPTCRVAEVAAVATLTLMAVGFVSMLPADSPTGVHSLQAKNGSNQEVAASGVSEIEREYIDMLKERIQQLEKRSQDIEKQVVGLEKSSSSEELSGGLLPIGAGALFLLGLIAFIHFKPIERIKEALDSLQELIQDSDADSATDGSLENDREMLQVMSKIGQTLFLVIVVIWLLVGLVPVMLSFLDLGVSGTFGDSFGFINALFSGLALGGVILALLMQTIELRYQRQELRETRDQLTRSAESAKESQFQFAKQTELSFLSTYLSSLKTLLDHEISITGDSGELESTKTSAKIKALLFRLERDKLNLPTQEFEQSEERTVQDVKLESWTNLLSELCSETERSLLDKRADSAEAVTVAREHLVVFHAQLENLEQDLPASNEVLISRTTSLKQWISDALLANSNAGEQTEKNEFDSFWSKSARCAEEFRKLLDDVESGRIRVSFAPPEAT